MSLIGPGPKKPPKKAFPQDKIKVGSVRRGGLRGSYRIVKLMPRGGTIGKGEGDEGSR